MPDNLLWKGHLSPLNDKARGAVEGELGGSIPFVKIRRILGGLADKRCASLVSSQLSCMNEPCVHNITLMYYVYVV